MDLKILIGVILFSLIIGSAHGKKRFKDPEKCGKPTCKVPSKFNYKEKMDYIYKYSATTNARFDGAGDESSEMVLTFLVHLRFLTKCEGIIKLTETSIFSGINGNMSSLESETLKLLEDKPLRFYYEDGHIGEICPEDDEPVWILNLKRGLLSIIQNTMDRFDVDQYLIERDVNGDCVVGYFFKEVDGTTLAIDKKIDISSCVNRYEIYSIIPMTPYIFQKKYHKYTPMNSSVFCSQHIDHKILTSVSCQEEHEYQPFYNQSNGAKSRAKAKLTLISEGYISAQDLEEMKKIREVKNRQSLLFDHRRPKKTTHDNLNECKQLLLSLCDINIVEFKPKYTEYFNRLIHVARDLSVPALHQLYSEAPQLCHTGLVHMMDALPYVRSRAATEIMVGLLKNETISRTTVSEWLLILTFYPRPDGDIVQSVSKLMTEEWDPQTLLTITTIIHNYCDRSPACHSHPAVLNILHKLEEKTNVSCISNNVTNAYSGLKALGNAGVMTDSINMTLRQCMSNEDLPISIRLEAIHAHRRLECETNRGYLLGIYTNKSMDGELRIAAYLQLVRCPSYAILHAIKTTLLVEEYNQVGAFVWSHLTTQMKSAYPNRVELQAILQNEYFYDKFDRNFRKYSRSYETSFYLNRYGVGVFLETHIIFSHKSYVPRTVLFNATISLFGENLNVGEISLYFHGLEVYFDDIFNKHTFFDKKIVESFVKLIRKIRSAPSTYQELMNLINEIPYPSILDEMEVTISLKMFGNEVNYFKIQGINQLKEELEKLNPMILVRKFFSGTGIDFNKSSMFIDMSYITPMMTGMALRLNAIGTAAIKFDAQGYINASRLKENGELNLKGKLVPSIGGSLECSLEIDSFVANSGVKFKATVYTSTALVGAFQMKSFKFMQVSFNLPLDKSDIVHAETHLLLITNGDETELAGITAGRKEERYCSWSLIDETIGLKLCANTLLPDKEHILESPLFLLSGPLQLGVTFEKSDPTAKLYIVEYKIETINNKTVLVFKFDTPDSVTKRGLKAVIDLDPQSQNLTLAYESSLTKVRAQGFYRNTPKEMLINFGLDINGQKHIDMSIGMSMENRTSGHTGTVSYYPKVLFAINGKKVFQLSGSIDWVKKNEISQCQIELDLKTNRLVMAISGYGRMTDVSIASNVRLDYKFANSTQHSVRIEIKLGNKSTKFLTSYQGQVQLESSAYPEINFILGLSFQKAQSHTDFHISLTTNPYIDDDRQKLKIRWHYQLYKAFSIDKRNITFEVIKPISGVDLKLAFFKQTTAVMSNSIAIIRYSRGKEVVITFDLNIPHGSTFYFENRITVTIPGASAQMSSYTKVSEKEERDYDLEFVGVWFSGHNLTMRGMYQDRSDLYISSHTIKILTRSQLFNDLLVAGRFLGMEHEIKTDVQVEHNDVSYGLVLHHKMEEEDVYDTFGEFLYDGASYTFTSQIDFNERRTKLDLHLDTYRDINIALHGLSRGGFLDAGLHIKWDANRDPSQKLNIGILTHSYGNLNYDGKAVIEYPGRTIKSSYVVQHEKTNYEVHAKVQWSAKGAIIAQIKSIYDMDVEKNFKIDGQVETPFTNWEYTSVRYEMKVNPQDIKSNGTVIWQSKQRLDLEISCGYQFSDEEDSVSFISQINSTIPEINSMQGILKYRHVENRISADFVVQSNPVSIVAVHVLGNIIEDEKYTQYHIDFGLRTPFDAARQADVHGDLNIFPRRKFKGQLQLIGNGKKYITTINGTFEHFNESHLNFHIATPVEKYKLIIGKYAFSASNKRFIADLKSTSVALGTELIYIYNNFSNFDLMLRARATISYDTSLLIVGKRDVDTLDFRFGWNKLIVGLIGRSHYISWNDVDYSLQVFTPFEGYSKSSAITKLIYKDRLDLEVSIDAGNKKIGLKVQGMKRPDKDFAEPYAEDLSSRDPNKKFLEPFDYDEIEYGNTYWRGVFQFDTSLYPTVYGLLQVNEDGGEYNTLCYVSFPFGQLKITDTLQFSDLLNFQNMLNVLTSCDCLETGDVTLYIGGVVGRHISSNWEVVAKIYNSTYKGDGESSYIYKPVSEDNDSEGDYNITSVIRSPFQKFRYGMANVLLQAVSPVYVGNFTGQLNNSTVYLDGTLENDGSVFITDLGVKMNTPLLVLPMCRLILSKDFTDFEKEIKVGLAFPNQKGDSLVNYGVGIVWRYEGPKYMKYTLTILTPIPAIGTIKTSVFYSNDPKNEEYFLELFLRYGEHKEITAWNSVKRDIFNFHVTSTHEAFKNISINGNLISRGYVRSLDAVLSLDREYKMYGSATINPKRPFTVDVKLVKVATDMEVFGLSLKVQKHANRYDISALIQRFQERINVLCDYILVDEIGKFVSLMLTSTYPGYEKLILFGEFLAQDYKAAVSKIEGDIVSKWLTTKAQLNLNASMVESLGVMDVELINKNVSVDAHIAWVNEPLEHMLLEITGTGSYRGLNKSISSRFHLWNIENEFQEVSLAADINYNFYDWWLTANVSMLWPVWNDLEFVSHAILPHKTDTHYRTLIKLFYDKSFNYSAIVLKYSSNPKNFNFQALTEISVKQEKTTGVVLMQTGKHRIYDQLIVLSESDRYDLRNTLRSTNLKEDLVIDIKYKKPEAKHNVKLVIYYPEPKSVANADVEFTALNNLLARANCSTPFKAFPQVQLLLKLITTRPLYQRFCEVLWANHSAQLNYTHASKWEKELQLTDGRILIDFPLTSRHTGILYYKYKSTETNALGDSSLSYNGDHLMSGNYSRASEFTELTKKEIIKINVNNSFLPTGIIYKNDFNKSDQKASFNNWDFKRIELYKLNDSTGFNITGEIEVNRLHEEKNTTFRVLHSLRKLVINSVNNGHGLYTSDANVTLRPNIWVAGGLQYFSKDDIFGRDVKVFFAYPRRYFNLRSSYDLNDDSFLYEVILEPNRYKTTTRFVGSANWKKDPVPTKHNIILALNHPSFAKNLTLMGMFSKTEAYPARFEADLEYSSDPNKKVSFHSYLRNVSVRPVFHYEYTALGSHPASRLKLTGEGYLRVRNRMVELRENITYKRSYEPQTFWYNGLQIDLINKMFKVERNSLRDLSYIDGRYWKENSSLYYNGTLINGKDVHVAGNLKLDLLNALTEMSVNLTEDGREKLKMKGWYRDHRHCVLNLWRQYEELSIPDVIFSTRLNHSRLLTFAFLWRPQIRSDLVGAIQDISSYITTYASETVNFWTQYFRTEIYDSAMDIWFDAKPILQDFIEDVRDIKDLEEDIEIFKKHFQEAYDLNEFYMQDIYKAYLDMTEEMSFKVRMTQVPKIVNELWEVMGETGETIRKSILWLVESVKKVYTKIVEVIRGLVTGETIDAISEYIQGIAGRYDKMMRDMHISFLHYMEQLWNETIALISSYWNKALTTIEPTFIQFAHYIESVFWDTSRSVLDFLYARQSEILKSSVFAKNTNLTKNLDAFYEDITKHDFITNLKKYAQMLIDLIRQQYFSFVPFGYELNEIGTEIVVEMKELYKLPFVNFTLEVTREVYNKGKWLYDYFNIKDRIQQFLPFMWKTIVDYSHTALENELINHGTRTKFIFEPDRGQITLEQKLPMSWHAFNDTPNYEDISEYKMASTVQKFILTPSNFSFWNYYYKIISIADPSQWLPPFGVQAVIIGRSRFVTFDGNHFEINDACTYLLSHDFVDHTFSLILKYENDNRHSLVLLTNNTVILIDLQERILSVNGDKNMHLPLQIGGTGIYAEESIINIESDQGFTLYCNFKFESCTLHLSGWHFGKVGGLLGMMDNEPRTDFFRSDGVMTDDREEWKRSWALGPCLKAPGRGITSASLPASHLNSTNYELCYSIFHSKASSFSTCFPQVDPAPFYRICLDETEDHFVDPVCSSAFAYLLACKGNFIPLRLPTFCINCPLPFNDSMEEGDFTKMEGPSVPMSTDVVFIMEAKDCNQYMRDRRMVHTFTTILSKELRSAGLDKNRYAVVVFGGDGIYDYPRNIVVNNQIFTNEFELPGYFEGIVSGNGNSDIFAALKFATKLQYRAGVSKTFILIPCSDCDLVNMTVEYNVLNQVFLEHNITLHVLMNSDFDFEKLRVSKKFYGLDSERAFTKNDFKLMKGDMDLRRQIKLSKSMMGYCTSLALETNGTIFTGKKMGSENLALVKKFSSVFAGRIAASARPDPCQTCECVTDQHGIDLIDCVPCSIPVPAYSDFEFRENGTLSSIWPSFDTISDPDLYV